jgi:hypothetical protein
MNLQNINDIKNSIDNIRRYENELFTKLHNEISRKEEILKIKKHHQKQHRTIQQLIRNLEILYETQIILDNLEKKK